jgi:hypothetical protein
MVSLLTSSAVDRVFEPPLFDVVGVMVSLLTSSVVDRVFEPPLFGVGGLMVSLLTSGVVPRVFEPPSGQDKDYRIGMFCFSTQHVTF